MALPPGQDLLEVGCGTGQLTDWLPATNAPVLITGQNTVILDATSAQEFYRLQRVQ